MKMLSDYRHKDDSGYMFINEISVFYSLVIQYYYCKNEYNKYNIFVETGVRRNNFFLLTLSLKS